MKAEDVIMTYWKSWQNHADWENTRKWMVDDFGFDAGAFTTDTADQLVAMMKQGNPWTDIVLLECMFEADRGVLLYEGTDSVTGKRFRISEWLTVEGDKVSSCRAAIAELPGS